MNCKWNLDDCQSEESRCVLCVANGLKYVAPKQKSVLKKRNTQKVDNRKGSGFEYANHVKNQELLSSKMTLNSGATVKEKGDEQILGIIRIMEELKTQMPDRARGTKSFTIHREWLDKLNKEAIRENMEFWYLKFAFSEDEGMHNAGNTFIITEQDVIMAMVKTMYLDRKKAKEADSAIDVYKKRWQSIQAENVFLKAKIEELEAEINHGKLLGKHIETDTPRC